jgi:DNA-binding protein YbaB
MFVSDLRHFLDLPDDTPGPARRMAEHLASVVRAATAAKAGTPWESALRCQRRPRRRACGGHIAVFRADLPAPIEWQCTACGDDGVISGWEDSYFDLRDPRSEPAEVVQVEIVISDEVAAALRDLTYVDTDGERTVFRARACDGSVVITGDRDDIDDLIAAAAAEANHETNRSRRNRLDAAFAALSEAPTVASSDAG